MGAKIGPFGENAKQNYLFIPTDLFFLTFVNAKTASSDILVLFHRNTRLFSLAKNKSAASPSACVERFIPQG